MNLPTTGSIESRIGTLSFDGGFLQFPKGKQVLQAISKKDHARWQGVRR